MFVVAAASATLLLYARQPLLIAYFIAGIVLGPHALSVLSDVNALTEIAHIGVVSLLFLIGLEMQPRALVKTIRQSLGVFFVGALTIFVLAFSAAYLLGFSLTDAIIIAVAAQFSSTIIGIKLLPTTILHHRHLGDLMVGILLLQDILAIIVIVVLDNQTTSALELVGVVLGAPLLIIFAFSGVRYVIRPLIVRFEQFQEYLFLLALGWMMGLALIGEMLRLSAEIGAFIAGVSLATLPVTRVIAVSMHPIRDFFLVIFFATLGAKLPLDNLSGSAYAAIVFMTIAVVAKPLIYRVLLQGQSESKALAWDIGIRLGVLSEFSLIIVFLATDRGLLSDRAAISLQLATIASMVVNTYCVTNFLPSPLAQKSHLKRN